MGSFEEAAAAIRAALASRTAHTFEVKSFRRAAVLVPVLRRATGPSILFTRRTETLTQHKGQVSFPGGGLEPGEDAVQGALREAREEVGLPSAEVLGVLDDQPSVSSYLVTPVVGLVPEPPASFTGQASEVSEPFEVPLSVLLDPARFRYELWDVSRMPPGSPVEELMRLRERFEDVDPATGQYKVYYFEPDPAHVIWGLTARILKQLLDVAFRFSP